MTQFNSTIQFLFDHPEATRAAEFTIESAAGPSGKFELLVDVSSVGERSISLSVSDHGGATLFHREPTGDEVAREIRAGRPLMRRLLDALGAPRALVEAASAATPDEKEVLESISLSGATLQVTYEARPELAGKPPGYCLTLRAAGMAPKYTPLGASTIADAIERSESILGWALSAHPNVAQEMVDSMSQTAPGMASAIQADVDDASLSAIVPSAATLPKNPRKSTL